MEKNHLSFWEIWSMVVVFPWIMILDQMLNFCESQCSYLSYVTLGSNLYSYKCFLNIYFHWQPHSYCDCNPNSSFSPLNLGSELYNMKNNLIPPPPTPKKRKKKEILFKNSKSSETRCGLCRYHCEFAANYNDGVSQSQRHTSEQGNRDRDWGDSKRKNFFRHI